MAVGVDLARACSACGAAFVPHRAHARTQHTCGRPACREASRDRRFAAWYRDNASWQCWRTFLRRQDRLTPEAEARLAALRGRGHVPPSEVRELLARAPDPPAAWAAGSPDVGTHLPGGACEVRVEPARQWDHCLARAVHGVVSRHLARGHARDVPEFATVLPPPGGRHGWLLFRGDRPAIAGPLVAPVLGPDRAVTLRGWHRLRAPAPLAPGQYRVRLVATGVVVHGRDGHREAVTRPTTATVGEALAKVARRVGLAPGAAGPLVAEVRAAATEGVEAYVGGHWQRGPRAGHVVGWVGHLDLEVNAPALWLLRCAARVGFGGSVSVGFGRVRLDEGAGG